MKKVRFLKIKLKFKSNIKKPATAAVETTTITRIAATAITTINGM